MEWSSYDSPALFQPFFSWGRSFAKRGKKKMKVILEVFVSHE
jgi:hypothetical protein